MAHTCDRRRGRPTGTPVFDMLRTKGVAPVTAKSRHDYPTEKEAPMVFPLNLEPHEEQALQELLDERGYASIEDLLRDLVQAHKSEQHAARIESLAKRMWPSGAPDPEKLQ
ncbi:MAG: hypothetical protein B5766_05435 [Candidatus Lumbricidophila eiseniae]|uniref:Uncharacterized protein n=1 Tax=Candidatus Lumbricidiphila eiseniae TaxID=1969409 RepID=A0A2A6FS12_9MICO|nr:MAG: hypothetical protein B5766_05435 [Candidatus Lumbricidophila eiseniae]